MSSSAQSLPNLTRKPKIAWNHYPPSFEPLRKAGLSQCLYQCVFPGSPLRSNPASFQGRNPASWHPETSPSTLPSFPRVNLCAAFKGQEAGPVGGQMRSGPRGGRGQCCAHRASLPDVLPTVALLQVPSRGPKAPYAWAPRLADGPGLGLLPRYLGSHRYHGSAKWTSRGTDTKLRERTDQWAR